MCLFRIIRGSFLFAETSWLKSLMEQGTSDQDIPIYHNGISVQATMETFLNMSLTSSCITDENFFQLKVNLMVLGLLSSAGLSEFLYYWTLN